MFSHELWANLSKGDIVEVDVKVELPHKYRELINVGSAIPLLEIFKDLLPNDPQSQQAITGISSLSQFFADRPIPLIMTPIKIQKFLLFLNL